MSVTIKTHRCIGAGACVLAAPEVFEQDDEGIVVLLQAEPRFELDESVRAAVRACPAAVIEYESASDTHAAG